MRGECLLDVQCVVADGAATVVVHGEVDMATAPELRQALAGALASGPDRLVVDLGPTSFIDCSGINAIAHARRTAPPGCEIILRSPSRLTQRVIELVGLAPWFLIDRAATASRAMGSKRGAAAGTGSGEPEMYPSGDEPGSGGDAAGR